MKKLLLIALAAASFAATVPASAQVVIREGRDGASVRIGGDRGYHRDRDYRRDRHMERRCRTVTERREGRHGRMIVTTRRICG